MILTADWHLVDSPSEEYRWDAFNRLVELCNATNDNQVFILGDLCDRKDRHSAALVNRMLDEFGTLWRAGIQVRVIMGNHDIPLQGRPFWNLLNQGDDGQAVFLWQPEEIRSNGKNFALLPFSPKPEEDWAEFIDRDWDGIDYVFMHQPIDGVLMENGSYYRSEHQLPIPARLPVYSGDIHTPQTVGNVRYVGAPHVVKFGDMYRCGMIQLHPKSGKVRKFFFNHVHRKWMIRGDSVSGMKASNDVQRGHQVKIEFSLPIAEVEKWPGIQADLRLWANDVGFDLVSTEAIVEMGAVKKTAIGMTFDNAQSVLEAFAEHEGLSSKALKIGLSILSATENDNT